jgi:hypothetical protein
LANLISKLSPETENTFSLRTIVCGSLETNGAPLIKVRGAWMSLSGRKKVEDAQGNHLFDIVKEKFDFEAVPRNGEHLFS